MAYRWFVALLISASSLVAQISPLTTYQLIDQLRPSGINNLNAITGVTGNSGFYRTAAGVVTTFDYPGATQTAAKGINDLTQIVGFYVDSANKAHGFVRQANGTMSTFDIPGAVQTYCYGINNSGQVAGTYIDATGRSVGFFGLSPASIR